MINTNTIINKLKNINYQFLANDKNGIKIDNKSYIFKKGEIPILLSASHAVKQIRESKVKPNDYLTGAIVLYLAEKCSCSYFVRVFNDNDDPNYPLGVTLSHVENEYLIALREFIQSYQQFLVMDIHGCNDNKKYDCSIWSDNYQTCDREIIRMFINNFNAGSLNADKGTEYLGGQVTRQSALLTNAFQIEIKRKIRSLKQENFYYLQFFLESMEKSIYETYDYSMKLERLRRTKR